MLPQVPPLDERDDGGFGRRERRADGSGSRGELSCSTDLEIIIFSLG